MAGDRDDVGDPAPPPTPRGATRGTGSLPSPTQIHPTTTAVSTDAAKRAPTISRWPANATAVDTRTTGLTAGAASRNVTATAGLTPRDTREPAIGTEVPSATGSTMPETAATGTPSPGRRGSNRWMAPGGTRTDTAADRTGAEHEEGERLEPDRHEDREPGGERLLVLDDGRDARPQEDEAHHDHREAGHRPVAAGLDGPFSRGGRVRRGP